MSQKERQDFPEDDLGPHNCRIRKAFCISIAKERGRRGEAGMGFVMRAGRLTLGCLTGVRVVGRHWFYNGTPFSRLTGRAPRRQAIGKPLKAPPLGRYRRVLWKMAGQKKPIFSFLSRPAARSTPAPCPAAKRQGGPQQATAPAQMGAGDGSLTVKCYYCFCAPKAQSRGWRPRVLYESLLN